MSAADGSLDLLGVAWRLGATLFFVLLNGFFVAAEFALVKVRRSRIAAPSASRSARRVKRTARRLIFRASACSATSFMRSESSRRVCGGNSSSDLPSTSCASSVAWAMSAAVASMYATLRSPALNVFTGR